VRKHFNHVETARIARRFGVVSGRPSRKRQLTPDLISTMARQESGPSSSPKPGM
jgi:hypothetical protein